MATGNDVLTHDLSETEAMRQVGLEQRMLGLGKAAGGDGRVYLTVSVQALSTQEVTHDEANPASGGQAPIVQMAALIVGIPNGENTFTADSIEEVFQAAEGYVANRV
jgi:hypothetical protein